MRARAAASACSLCLATYSAPALRLLLDAAALLGCGRLASRAFGLCRRRGDGRRDQFASLLLFAPPPLLGLGVGFDRLELGRRPRGEPEGSVRGEGSSPTEPEPPIA